MDAWTPLCMEPEEWAGWQHANHRSGPGRLDRPCQECPLGFALEMRALERCNGEPGGWPDDEEAPMSTINVLLEAPCPACLHREVCGIRQELEAARGDVGVELPQLPTALTPIVTLAVECSFFIKDKGIAREIRARKAPAGGNWTPERRARMAESMRQRLAAKAAAGAAG